MENNTIQIANQGLFYFSIIFLSGVLAVKAATRLRIPDIICYILVGILLGSTGLDLIVIAPDAPINQVILSLGASLILFHGGLTINLNTLRKGWITLSLTSTLAVAVMTLIVGYAAHLILAIPLVYGFLLAATIAPTDPAALIPIFLALRIKPRLTQIIVSESAFNDATGAIVTLTLLNMVTTGTASVTDSILTFFLMASGGLLVGCGYGLSFGYIITQQKRFDFSGYVQPLLLPIIAAAYLTAEEFGASGFMAVFTMGVLIGNHDYLGWTFTEQTQKEFVHFVHFASLVSRMAIFLLLGTQIDWQSVQSYVFPGLLVVGVFLFIARPIAVACSTLPDRNMRWSKNEILLMCWTRETGVIPATLAGLLSASHVAYADRISAVVILAILVTLFVQAPTTRFLAQKLKLLEPLKS